MHILVEDIFRRRILVNADKIVLAEEFYPKTIEDHFQIIAHLSDVNEIVRFTKIAYTYHDQSIEFKQIHSLAEFYLYLSEMQNQN